MSQLQMKCHNCNSNGTTAKTKSLKMCHVSSKAETHQISYSGAIIICPIYRSASFSVTLHREICLVVVWYILLRSHSSVCRLLSNLNFELLNSGTYANSCARVATTPRGSSGAFLAGKKIKLSNIFYVKETVQVVPENTYKTH